MATVWYRVRELDAARAFYRDVLGFEETFVDWDDRWAKLVHGGMEVAIAEGEPDAEGGVAHVDVEDVKAEAERLRAAGVEGRCRLRADGRDQTRGRLRSGRQPAPARAAALTAPLVIRRAGTQDGRFLREMLRHALYWRERVPGSLASRYVRGWGRPGDTALIALEGGFAVGAAWYRVFAADEPGYGFVDEHTPELAIAVVPSKRGHGIGEQLLAALIERARAGGYSGAQPQRRAGKPGPQAVRAKRLRGRTAGRGGLDDARVDSIAGDDRVSQISDEELNRHGM